MGIVFVASIANLHQRLNVVKALISETNGSAKTASPIQTDIQLLSLITKKLAAAKDASEQFLAAGRPDLKEKEDAQVKVWEHYASQVETMGPEEIKTIVSSVITRLQNEGGNVNPGTVLKSLLGPGGALDGKPVAKADVAQSVKELLAQPKA